MLELYNFQFSAMGTACALHLYAQSRELAEAVAELAEDEVLRIEALYSRYNPDSYLSRINRVAESGGTMALDAEPAGLLDYACACYAKSHGLFDITSGVLREAWDFSSGHLPRQSDIDALLPRIGLAKVQWQSPVLTFTVPGMQLDFGGLAKEYAADRVAAICRAMAIAHGLVDLGGDIHVIGPHPDGTPWRIGIRHPRDESACMASVEIARGAIASSGDYERFMEIDGKRYCHFLDPRTGWPVHGLSAASVLAEQCLVAGSVSSIAMLKGAEGKRWLQQMGVSYACMDEQNGLERTEPFQPA